MSEKIWVPIAAYGYKREHAPAQFDWVRLGTIMYKASDHSCAIVTDIIQYGTFYAKPFNQSDNLPNLQGDIKVFNSEWGEDSKKKYDHIGKIITHSADGSGEVSYQVELWGFSSASFVAKMVKVVGGDTRPGFWQTVHLEDRDAYQPERYPAEDENQDAPPSWEPEKGDAFEEPNNGMDSHGNFVDENGDQDSSLPKLPF